MAALLDLVTRCLDTVEACYALERRMLPEVAPCDLDPCNCDPPCLPAKPSLPQHDPAWQQRRRKRQLERSQEVYRYNYTYVPPLAMSDTVPVREWPAVEWLMLAAKEAITVVENLIAVLEQPDPRPGVAASASATAARKTAVDGHRKRLGTLRSRFLGASALSIAGAAPQVVQEFGFGSRAFNDLRRTLEDVIRDVLESHDLFGRPHSIADYNREFQVIQLPQFARWFRDERAFAQMRVAGQNPLVLRLVESPGAKFPVTDAQYQAAMSDTEDSLALAGRERRLFVCDYAAMADMQPGDFPESAGQKYVYAPIALFAFPRAGRRELRAVAIQARQKPGRDNPIFTPADGVNWEIAKTIVQNADGNDSEFYQHLGLTHLLVEAFAMATARQLPRNHPLNVLLTPHFEGTIFTNNTAQSSMNSPSNLTKAIISSTIPSALGLAAQAVTTLDFSAHTPPQVLRARGVDDPEVLPEYPYRDDGLLVWGAIRQWVSDYLALYYQSEDDVLGDYELQAWVAELVAPDGGRLKGVGQDGRMPSFKHLVENVALVIFQASAQHAATNFPLSEYEIYTPGEPLALYQPPPKRGGEPTEKDWLDYLPPLQIALLQQTLGFVVGNLHFTRLGYYPPCHFADERVRKPLQAFQSTLASIQSTIEVRNTVRPVPYPWLLPSRVPQSTNI